MHTEDLSLHSLSPLDGRYSRITTSLSPYFSEFALNGYRIEVELKYWIFFLNKVVHIKLSSSQIKHVLDIVANFDEAEAKHLKTLEKKTGHDVKAIEYYLREKLTTLQLGHLEYLHFGLTSDDINSVAYALAIKQACAVVLFPTISQIISCLSEVVEKQKAVPMLARTHGQPAVPTTVGKEFAVTMMRLHTQLQQLKKIPYVAKFSGAIGNFNAHQLAFPDQNWIALSDKFLHSLGLEAHHYSTQIVPMDSYLQLFHHFCVINSILIDSNQDIWRYISDEYFVQQVDPDQVGSSTMPQKVNPIDFENSEGNLGISNSLLQHFIAKFPISRLQRDLSDSTVKRSIGSAFGYSLIGYQSYQRGLAKISPNYQVLEQTLLDHWEIVTEGIQTMLRKHGDDQAYEKLKQLSRGQQLTEQKIMQFIQTLRIPLKEKEKLLSLTPLNYIGLAVQIVQVALKELHEDQK